MNILIKNKLVSELSALEETLFTLHRDCGEHSEMCALGAAWISVKEARNYLVQDRAAMPGLVGGAAQGKTDPAKAVVNAPDQSLASAHKFTTSVHDGEVFLLYKGAAVADAGVLFPGPAFSMWHINALVATLNTYFPTEPGSRIWVD